MNPPRTSLTSSPSTGPRVNEECRAGDVRLILRIERRLRRYRPRPHGAPAKPDGAERILDALAGAHRPGDRLNTAAIAATAGIGRELAAAVRRWARSEGCWPYADALSGFEARAGGARRPEGGAS